MKDSISIFKIYVYKEILNSQQFSKQEKQFIYEKFNNFENIKFDTINLDEMTIEDLKDFLEFSDSNNHIFILNEESKRLKNILNWIEKTLEDNLYIISPGHTPEIINSLNSNDLLQELTFTNSINFVERLNISHSSINSGLYNLHAQAHIKHIIVDNLRSLEKLNESILLNTGINSLIIFQNKEEKKNENINVFSILISEEDFISYIPKNAFRTFDLNKEVQEIENFYETGSVNNSNTGLPKNLKYYLSNNHVHSLFIKDSSIYYDVDFNHIISKSLDVTIFELINEVQYINNPLKDFATDQLIHYYYIANVLCFEKQENLVFVTPSNMGIFPAITNNDLNSSYKYCMGYIDNQGMYYIYNFKIGKTVKVSKYLFICFEALLKNRENEIIKNNETLNKVKDMLENVQ